MTPDDPHDRKNTNSPPEGARSATGAVTLPKVPPPQTTPSTQADKSKPPQGTPQPEKTAPDDELTRRRIQLALLEKRRQEKRRWVRTQRFKLLVRLVYVFLLGATLWVVYQNPFWIFRRPDFQLLGNTLMAPRHLVPIVADLVGRPLFEIDPQTLEATLHQHYPIIDQVHVRRYLFPARLVFYIVEKRPVALLYDNVAVRTESAQSPVKPAVKKGAPPPARMPEQKIVPAKTLAPFALLTEDDQVIPTALYKINPAVFASAESQRSVSRIIIPHALSSGQLPSAAILKGLHTILFKVGAIPGLHLQSLTYLPAAPKNHQPEQVILQFTEGKVLLGQLDSEVYRRLDRLPPLVPKMLEMKNGLAYVDLRWGEQTTFKMKAQVIARPEPPPAV